MLHIWQASLQGALRVWHKDNGAWRTLQNWQEVQDNYDDSDVCLYAPSQLFMHLHSSLPVAQLKQLGVSGQQYLFEDIALTPVEQLRVRTVSNSHNEEHLLYATAINDVNAWQKSAALVEFDVIALLPDFVLLPIPVSTQGVLQGARATLYHDNETTLLRQSENLGFAISYLPLLTKSLPQLQEVDLLSTVISFSASKHDSLSANKDSPAIDNLATGIAEALNTQDITVYKLSEQPIPVQSPHRHPLNFVEKVNQSKFSPYLKVAMLTALCAGMVQMSADALQIYQYKQATTQVAQATNEQFSSWIQGQSLNPRVEVMTQMRPYLIAGSTDDSMQLATLERISPIIKQSAISTQSLIWDDDQLTLQLVSPERQRLDKLMSALVEQGIAASLGRIEPREDGSIVGEVKVNITAKTIEDPA